LPYVSASPEFAPPRLTARANEESVLGAIAVGGDHAEAQVLDDDRGQRGARDRRVGRSAADDFVALCLTDR
jgi:hypothetical protein